VDEYTTYFREYQALGEEIQEAMSYTNYCNTRLRTQAKDNTEPTKL
jgi:hypothetical protein